MRFWFAAAVGLATALTAFANAEAESPFYVSGSVGGYFRESDDAAVNVFHDDTPTVTVPATTKRSFDPGVMAAIAVGYRFGTHIRLEGEFDYSTYKGESLNPYTAAAGFPMLNGQRFKLASGDKFSRYTTTMNAFYDFSPIAGRFTPYVGGGLGVVQDDKTVGSFVSSTGTPFGSTAKSETDGVAVVEGGVSIALTPRLSIVPAYRYVRIFTGDQDVAHVVKIGLRYSF